MQPTAPPIDEQATALALLGRMHERLTREGVGWYKEGVFEVSRCALREGRIARSTLDFWQLQGAPLLWQALNEVAPRLYEENVWVQEVLGLDAEKLAYLRRFRAPGQPVFEYFGVDSLEPERLIVDVNSRPGVVGYLDEIRAACLEARGEDSAMPSFNEALFARMRAYSPKGVAVVLPERGFRFGDKRRIAEVARRYLPDTRVYRLSELRELGPRERPEVLFLTMIPADILAERDKFSGLLALARSGVPIINAPESFLAASKAMMHLLAWSGDVETEVLALLDADPEQALAKRALLRELFVPSVLVHGGIAYAPDQACGVGAYLSGRDRKQCVVKAAHTAGGRGVYHGAHLTRTRWRDLVERMRRGGTWVVEEAHEHQREDIWGVVGAGGEDVGLGDAIEVRRVYARILYRTYAVQGAAGVFQEVFAGRGWKVSAAGWSLAAEYEDATLPAPRSDTK